MKRTYQVLAIVLIFSIPALALPQLAEAKGPPVRIDSSVPPNGTQGETNIPVTLFGDKFENAVPEVSYIHKLTGKVAPPSKMAVSNPNFVNSKEITYTLAIGDEADVGEYDIEIYYALSGRKGKGTTLFSVKAKNQDVRLSCDLFVTSQANCGCEFYKREETNEGTPPLSIYGLIDNCTTDETLVIPQFHQLQSYNPGGDDSFRRRITAVPDSEGKFNGGKDGSTIIAAEGHRARLLYIDLDVGAGVETGCGENLESAVRFVLDGNSPDPALPDERYRHTRWLIASLEIDSPANAALCRGIEVIRTPDYSWGDAADGLVEISGSWLKPNSWEQTGIRFEGFVWLPGSLAVPDISFNVIEAPADGAAGAAVAIEIGPVSSAETGVIDAVVAENVISMAGAGAGIVVYGGPEMGAVINKNSVSGAQYGVLIDGSLVDANLAGNTLTGDGNPASGDKAVCTDTADTTDRGKPNRISGFDEGYNDIVIGCNEP